MLKILLYGLCFCFNTWRPHYFSDNPSAAASGPVDKIPFRGHGLGGAIKGSWGYWMFLVQSWHGRQSQLSHIPLDWGSGSGSSYIHLTYLRRVSGGIFECYSLSMHICCPSHSSACLKCSHVESGSYYLHTGWDIWGDSEIQRKVYCYAGVESTVVELGYWCKACFNGQPRGAR